MNIVHSFRNYQFSIVWFVYLNMVDVLICYVETHDSTYWWGQRVNEYLRLGVTAHINNKVEKVENISVYESCNLTQSIYDKKDRKPCWSIILVCRWWC